MVSSELVFQAYIAIAIVVWIGGIIYGVYALKMSGQFDYDLFEFGMACVGMCCGMCAIGALWCFTVPVAIGCWLGRRKKG